MTCKLKNVMVKAKKGKIWYSFQYLVNKINMIEGRNGSKNERSVEFFGAKCFYKEVDWVIDFSIEQ